MADMTRPEHEHRNGDCLGRYSRRGYPPTERRRGKVCRLELGWSGTASVGAGSRGRLLGWSSAFWERLYECVEVDRWDSVLRLEEGHGLLVVVLLGEGGVEEAELVVWF
jgi:hypothetical protein